MMQAHAGNQLIDKQERLLRLFADMPPAAVALSGGVDSAVAAAAAFRAQGRRAVAVTAKSPSVPRSDLEAAQAVAESIGMRHVFLSTQEFSDPNYVKNDGTRCYFCKSELYRVIFAHLHDLGAEIICSGANADDLCDFRPGLTAAAERGVRHPLIEAGLSKRDVRELAKAWQLPVWNKPASPCLASRIVPGLEVTPARTRRIEAAEQFLRNLGLADCRVRHHADDLARIEVGPEALPRLAAASLRDSVVQELQRLGFRFVTLDLAGFRSGSFNEMVPLEIKSRFHHHETPVTA